MEEQSFIVRFYRFDTERPENAVGMVQAAESGLCMKFNGMDGLWQAMLHLQTSWDSNHSTKPDGKNNP